MTQADYLIGRFGGMSAMARTLGIVPTVVQGWRIRGHVPGKRLQSILEAGQALSPPLDESEFFRSPNGVLHQTQAAA